MIRFYRVMCAFPRMLSVQLELHGLRVADVTDTAVMGSGDDELDRLEHVIEDAANAAGVGEVIVTTWAMPELAKRAIAEDRAARADVPFGRELARRRA